MKHNISYILLFLIIIIHENVAVCKTKPNIVIIVADDMGFHDCSYHGSDEIKTPNIDSIGYNGLILNKHYVQPMCTPSRSALMTGKYPIHTGMENFVIDADEPWGLGLEELLLPEFLKTANYTTYQVGKWHLGMFKKAYNPIQRGYDHFSGFLGPYIDYYDHSLVMLPSLYPTYGRGYDMRRNESVYYETRGQYATDLFTNVATDMIKKHDTKKPMYLIINYSAPHAGNEDFPLQAPQEEINKFSYIQDPNRRTYAAMMSILDKGIGKVVKSLDEKGILENTIILFMADNGAPTAGQHANYGSNFPLKGQKGGPFEGAIRGSSVIWSAKLKTRERVSNQLVHITDWFPTFLKLAGVPVPTNIDGVDVWSALSLNMPSPRTKVLHNIDDVFDYSSYYKNGYKYVNGSIAGGAFDGYLGVDKTSENGSPKIYTSDVINSDAWIALNKYSKYASTCKSNVQSERRILKLRKEAVVKCPTINAPTPCGLKVPCLFDMRTDPCERINLANSYPLILQDLQTDLDNYRLGMLPPRNKLHDPRAAPSLNNYTWTWWLENVI